MRKGWQIGFVVVLTAFAYFNIFNNDFVIDDRVFILDWEAIRGFSVVDFFKGAVPTGHEGVYRPVRSIFYALYYQLFGTNPWGWHLHSLVVHIAATVLVYFIVARILEVGGWKLDLEPLKSRILDVKKSKNQGQGYRTSIFKNSVPFVSSLLFGLHPIHTESIAYIAASMEMTGAVFFFASFYLYLRRKELGVIGEVGGVVFALLAFFTYEMTLTLPLLILLHRLLFHRRATNKSNWSNWSNWSNLAPYFLLAGFYALVRVFVAGATTRGPYLADSFYLTMLTMTKVFVKYISLLILPINQANNHAIGKGIEAFVYRDYRTEAIAVQSIFDQDIFFSLAILAMLAIVAIWSFRRHPLITFSIAWFFISLLPVSEIIPQGSMMNEKMLYIPSFGFILLFSYVILRPPLASRRISDSSQVRLDQNDKVVVTFILLIAVLYGYLTFQRNKDWKDEITLWSKDIQVYPTENAYAYYQLGNALVRAGRVDEAILMYERSSVINTKFVLGLGSIAIILANADRTDEAISMYKKAIEINPSFWEGRFNLGNLYMQQGKRNPALEQYRAVLEINPNFLPAKQHVE